MGISKEDYIKQNFPEINIGVKPSGNQIVVQLRQIKEMSAGGIVYAKPTRDINQDNTEIARLISVGQIAYKHRETGEVWKEGAWASVGDIVITPQWGGFRFKVPHPEGEITFAVFEDFHIKGVIEDNFEVFDTIK